MDHIHIVQISDVRVIPDDDPSGNGILVDGSMSLPFTLERSLSGVQGYYFEQYLILADGKQVFASSPQQIFVRGLQSITSYSTHVDERIPLSAGSCQLVFVYDDVPSDPVEVPVNAVAPV
jgi:hypothetical protein